MLFAETNSIAAGLDSELVISWKLMDVFEIVPLLFMFYYLGFVWCLCLFSISIHAIKSKAGKKVRIAVVFIISVILIAHSVGYKVMGSASTYDNRVGESIKIDVWRDIDNTLAEIRTITGEVIKIEKEHPYLMKDPRFARDGLYIQSSGEIFYYHRALYCGNTFHSSFFPERHKQFRVVRLGRIISNIRYGVREVPSSQ